MRADLSHQMKKKKNQHARIPHIGKAGTPYFVIARTSSITELVLATTTYTG